MKLSQRDRILYELRQAGEAGVRSDHFYMLHLPRFAARVLELKEAGYDIDSEREGKFCRYTLKNGVGVGAAALMRPGNAGRPGNDREGSADPGDSPETHDAGTPSLEPVSEAPGSGEARLFDTPERRPLSAFTDSEAA